MPRPRKDAKLPTKRIQVEMPPASLARLRKLQEVTEAQSYAEVVKNALRLYEALIAETEAGSEILVRRDKAISPLHIFGA
jgi:Arc/MetJ-type ribon-helix-helix transcriptional regulator